MTAREPAPRAAVPEGTGSVAAGLLVLGVSSYVVLTLAGRALGPTRFGALSVMYLLTYAVGPGLFHPLEQELARLTAGGTDAVAVLRRGAKLAAAIVALLAVVAAAAAGPVADEIFDGQRVLVAGLVLGIAGIGAAHVTRGSYAGTQRFGRYAAQLALEGVLRVGACVVLVIAGTERAGPFALLLGLAPLAAVLLTLGLPAHADTRTAVPAWSQLVRAIGLLVAAAVLSQGLVNVAPLVVELLADEREQDAAGRFTAAFVLARIPLFLFAAIQATLLPSLARAIVEADHGRFRHELGRALAVVGALGAAGLVLAAAAGPWAVRLAFGEEFQLARRDVVLLAASTAAVLLAMTLQPAVIALGAHGRVALAWLAGWVVFIAFCIPEADVLWRTQRALLAGCVATAVAMAAQTRAAARTHA